jgi:hypothetical protein
MKYNSKSRTNLIQNVKKQGGPKKKVLVSLEDFFDGNNDERSIGHMNNHPGIDVFSKTLYSLRDNKDVEDVLIEIKDIKMGHWPKADMVYITSCLKYEYIKNFLKALKYDEFFTHADDIKQLDAPEGYSTIAVWWHK